MYVQHSWLRTRGHSDAEPIKGEVDPAVVIRKLNSEHDLKCPEEFGYFIWDYMMLTYPTSKIYKFDPEEGLYPIRYLSEEDADGWFDKLVAERQWSDDSWKGVTLRK